MLHSRHRPSVYAIRNGPSNFGRDRKPCSFGKWTDAVLASLSASSHLPNRPRSAQGKPR